MRRASGEQWRQKRRVKEETERKGTKQDHSWGNWEMLSLFPPPLQLNSLLLIVLFFRLRSLVPPACGLCLPPKTLLQIVLKWVVCVCVLTLVAWLDFTNLFEKLV